MAKVLPPGFADVRCFLKHANRSEEWQVTFGVENNTGANDPDVLAGLVGAQFDIYWGQAGDTSVVFTRCELLLGQDGPDPLIGSATINGNGGASFETPPANCCLVVSKRSALSGRHNRGRFYIPSVLSESEVNELGVIADISGQQLLMNGFLFNLGTADVPMVILHDALAPGVGTPTPVTSLLVRSTIGSQRRRIR